jgi:hypothetical protein
MPASAGVGLNLDMAVLFIIDGKILVPKQHAIKAYRKHLSKAPCIHNPSTGWKWVADCMFWLTSKLEMDRKSEGTNLDGPQ